MILSSFCIFPDDGLYRMEIDLNINLKKHMLNCNELSCKETLINLSYHLFEK